MALLTYTVLWLAACIWASSFVARRVTDAQHRLAYYLLIWLVPFLGAFAAMLIAGLSRKSKKSDASAKMFDSLVDAHKDSRD